MGVGQPRSAQSVDTLGLGAKERMFWLAGSRSGISEKRIG
jgi:hypothetical protein